MSKKGRHTSVDQALRRTMASLEKIPHITKIVLGFSEACRHKYPPGSLRFKSDVDGGIKVNAYAGFGVIDVFLKIDPITEREAIKALLKKRYS